MPCADDPETADATDPRYTHGHHRSVVQSHGRRSAADSAAHLLPHLTSGMEVLDVGCGPGSITLDLAAAVGPQGRVTGIENVPEPLALARALAAERGDRRTRFEQADVYRLPYPDDRFDVVHAHQVLQHLTDPVAALVEMGRVCRPGGMVAARDADYEKFAWHPASPGLDDWLARYRRLARANGAEPDAGRRLRSWFLAAGFSDLACTGSMWVYADDEDRRWWGESWAQRVTQSAFADQAVQRGLATREDLDRLAAAWREWAGEPDGWFAIPHGEVLARI